MFRKKGGIKGHDRYAMYGLIGRTVEFPNPRKRSKTVRGVVEDVFRDIFEDTIGLEMEDGRVHLFKEPAAILKADGDVVLVYGDTKAAEDDEETWGKLREKGWKETMQETLKRTARAARREVRISVDEGEPARKRMRRR